MRPAIGGAARVATTIIVVTALIAIASTKASGGVECQPVSASVNVRGLEIVPPPPITVGSQVELRFDVMALVYQTISYRLEGADGLFAGEMFRTLGPFSLTAIAPGTAMVRLALTYATEEACDDGQGGTYFRPGPNMTHTSDAFTIVVDPLPTASPTTTSTPTPSPTAILTEHDVNGGCAIDRTGRGGWLLLLPLLVVFRRYRDT